MQAVSLLWMADSLTIATGAFLAPLLLVPRKLLQALTNRKRARSPARKPHAPRPASTYTMLVASDVQRGMRGILP
jgi:hypothetical protein